MGRTAAGAGDDILTSCMLTIVYNEGTQHPKRSLTYLMISFNPLSIITVCLLNTNIFYYFFFAFALEMLTERNLSQVGIIALSG